MYVVTIVQGMTVTFTDAADVCKCVMRWQMQGISPVVRYVNV